MRVIGLTGNIACGKSEVARILSNLGAAIIDADQVARTVVLPGSATLAEITKTFGTGVLNAKGELDRTKVRQLIFSDNIKRKTLESILHPAIRDRSQELIDEKLKAGHKLVVYEAALLIEAGRLDDFDGVLVIACNDSSQHARVLARDPSLSAEIADQMIQAQMPQAEKLKSATWIIENNGSLEDLKTSVQQWYNQFSMTKQAGSLLRILRRRQ